MTSGTAPTLYTCSVECPVISATIYISNGVTSVGSVLLKPSGAKIDLVLVKASANPITPRICIKVTD
jgi:hypothetical protein